MSIFKKQPTPSEICVERVKAQRTAAESGSYDAFFASFNAARMDGH
jgi:hypothetical protein